MYSTDLWTTQTTTWPLQGSLPTILKRFTGHLGSFLEKKTETQIQLEKNTQNKGWVTVSCKRSRSFSFDDFSFKVNQAGLPEVVDTSHLDDLIS